MNINFLTPKISNINTVPKVENSHNSTPVMQSKLSPLTADTVSFTGVKDKATKAASNGVKRVIGPVQEEIQKRGATLLDFLGVHYETVEMPRYERLANNFLNACNTNAEKLRAKGLPFSFDMGYNSQFPVKSRKSFESKVERSKSFTVYDPIRDTVYCSDPYDLSNLEEFLREQRASGYIVAPIDVPIEKMMKKGYIPTPEEIELGIKTVKVPDIDIRLDNSLLDMDSLPENLKYFVSDKLPSGLEDVQIRFIRPCDLDKQNPVYHETLIMFGPNSTLAKHQEHRDVYQWVRKFEELEVPLEETSLRTHAGKAKHYISMIKDMFRGKVSQKLFINAKNKDYAGIEDEVIIGFQEQDIKLFEGYFNGLRDRINSVYAQLRKSTPYANFMKTRDQKRIQEIYEALGNTINYYNSKVGLPLVEIKKPAK